MPNTTTPTAPIRIHSFPLSGHAHRVVLFASLAKIPHEIINVDLAAAAHKQPPFLALNPQGQVPVIEDADQVITDSNAILVYLAKAYAPDYLPEDPVQAAEVQKVLTWCAGDMIFGPASARLITVFGAKKDFETCKSVAEGLFAKLDAHLEGRDFLVGDRLTIADVALYPYAAHAPEGNISLAPYPNLRRLLDRIEALEGFVPMPATPVGLAVQSAAQ